MILAEEYRKGIWVMDVAPHDKYYQVDLNMLINALGNGYQYRGIPLTPEWLEILGFEKDRNGWHLPGTQFSLTDNLFPCWLDRMLWPGGMPDFHHVELKYVHQLQNLYFALTGEELNLKL